MKFFENALHELETAGEAIADGVKKLFTTDEAENVLKEVATVALKIQPYVIEVGEFVGKNPIAAKVIAAYEKYAVPYAEDIEQHSASQLVTDTDNLVVAVAQKNGVQASSIETLQLAVGVAKQVVATATTGAAPGEPATA